MNIEILYEQLENAAALLYGKMGGNMRVLNSTWYFIILDTFQGEKRFMSNICRRLGKADFIKLD